MNQLNKARKEILSGRLPEWPRHRGAYICSKEQPMPVLLKDAGRWAHLNATETDADSENYIEYKCDNCGHIFRAEMPD